MPGRHALSIPSHEDLRSLAVRQIVVGAVLLAVGIAISLVTYEAAHGNSGRYVFAFGPIVVGAIAMFRGLLDLLHR
jgi:hypothetical protein